MTHSIDTNIPVTDLFPDDHLAHYGVKGMKWGRRKGKTHISNRAKAKKVKSELSRMSDQELQNRINRLRNEDAYRQLVGVKPASKTLTGRMKSQAKESMTNALTRPVSAAAGGAVTMGMGYVAKEVLTPTIKVAAAGYTLKKNMNL